MIERVLGVSLGPMLDIFIENQLEIALHDLQVINKIHLLFYETLPLLDPCWIHARGIHDEEEWNFLLYLGFGNAELGQISSLLFEGQ